MKLRSESEINVICLIFQQQNYVAKLATPLPQSHLSQMNVYMCWKNLNRLNNFKNMDLNGSPCSIFG